MARKKIAIVGAGVIGLTTACELSSDFEITVLGDLIGRETDSWKATAIWHVYLVPETEEVLKWAQQTLEKLYAISLEEKNAGVGLVKGLELFRKGFAERPTWANIPRTFRMLSQDEINEFNNISSLGFLREEEIRMLVEKPVLWGYEIEAPVADMLIYLEWLKSKAIESGVKIHRQHVESLESLFSGFDIVINCTGFRAREIANDKNFKSFRGQYFVLRSNSDAPVDYIGDDDHPGGMAYFIPRFGEVMIGGCAEEGLETLDITLDWEDTINRAGLYAPWVRERKIEDQARDAVVGLRPFREGGIRLERDINCNKGLLLHNYGHGGSGFSLSWGCAKKIKELIEECFSVV